MLASVMPMMKTLVRLSLDHIAAFVRSILAFFGTTSSHARDALRTLIATTTKFTKPKASYEATEITTVVAVAIIETDDDDATASESEPESGSEVEENDEVFEAQVADEDHATELVVMIHEDRDDHDEDQEDDEDGDDEEEVEEDDQEDGEDGDDQEDARGDQQVEEDVSNDPIGPPHSEETSIVWPTITLDAVEADVAFDWTIQVYKSLLDGQQAHGSVLLQRRLLGI
jgi:hypothetical protein